MALGCRTCGASIALIEHTDETGAKKWIRLDAAPVHVERNERGYVETVLLRNHWCDRPGEKRRTQQPGPAPAPDRDAASRAVSQEQLDATMPAEPARFSDYDDIPF